MLSRTDQSSWHNRRRRRALLTLALVLILGCAGVAVAVLAHHDSSSATPPTSDPDPPGSTDMLPTGTASTSPPVAPPQSSTAPSSPNRSTPPRRTTTSTAPRPPGSSTSSGSSRALQGKTIVIDPGHQLGNSTHLSEIDKLVNGGGFLKPCNTTGTATNAGFPEATFNWDVALDLRAQLEAEGAKVVMTRNTNSYSDWGPCVDVRGRLGNEVHADAVISIHGDGAASSYHGFFVIVPGLVPGWTDDILDSSHLLGLDVHAGLVSAGATIANDYGGQGYSIRTDLGTLNWSNVPVVMVELGNMRNSTDAAQMTSAAYRSGVYARGLALGVTTFVTSP